MKVLKILLILITKDQKKILRQIYNQQNIKPFYYNFISMEKCEHNQKIIQFCVSEMCIWREAGGCANCIKKYHNHIGKSVFIDQKQIENLFKKVKGESSTKPKIKTLEESIHNYFNNLKLEIINFIDELDRKIRTQLCYPYLAKYSIINTYKRLKKKQYRKITQKDFKIFYQLVNNLKNDQFNEEEKKFYLESIKKYKESFIGIFEVFNNLESKSKTIQNLCNLKTDKFLEAKINTTFDNIIDQASQYVEEQKSDKSKEQKNYQADNETSIIQVTKNITKPSKMPQRSEIQKPNFNKQSSSLPKDFNKKQEELNQMKKKLLGLMEKQEVKIVQTPHDTHQKHTSHFAKHLSFDDQFQYTIVQPQINVQSKQTNIKLIKPNKNNVQQNNAKSNLLKVQNLTHQKNNSSTHSIYMQNNNSDSSLNIPHQKNNHTLLPSKSIQGAIKKIEKQNHNEPPRAIVIPLKGNSLIEPDINSPILKRKRQVQKLNFNNFSIKPIEQKQQELKESPHKIQFSNDQGKSIALLNQSLNKKPEEAILLLQKSFQLSTNNLSTAQYLSFLLLEQQKPLDALKVCNTVLHNLKGEVIYDVNSLHIHNNKSVALIMLGRYSQAIILLEKCIQIKQSDRFYKNLGDAYFSIGIYQKSVYNYQKSIKLNNNYDEAYYNLAVCLFVQQNYYNAQANIEKAISINPHVEQYKELRDQIKEKI